MTNETRKILIPLYGANSVSLHLAESVAETSAKTRLFLLPRTEENVALIQSMAGGSALLEAATYTLQHVIAGLSAGTQPEPQCLKASHEKLFRAVEKTNPTRYGRKATDTANITTGVKP